MILVHLHRAIEIFSTTTAKATPKLMVNIGVTIQTVK